MLASFERPAIDALVLLHVGGVHEEIERLARQHGFNVWVMMRDFEPLRLALGALGLDVAQADDFDERRLGELRQILIGNAAAADQPGADAPRRRVRRERADCARSQRGPGEQRGFGEVPTVEWR